MSFNVAGDAYDRFMGRYSQPLAVEMLALLDPRPGQRALDVGCGPGALTTVLVDRLGADAVTAVDPSDSFVAAARERLPDVDVRTATAEQLPFADDAFDLTVAQLVVHFMTDPVAGLAEMDRVTRPGGTVAACVWDHAGGSGPLSLFWRAVRDLQPDVPGEAMLRGTWEGDLERLFGDAGLTVTGSTSLTVQVPYATVQEWWEPYTLGVGPAGVYVAGLDERSREALRARCAELLPDPPYEMRASAWAVTARA